MRYLFLVIFSLSILACGQSEKKKESEQNQDLPKKEEEAQVKPESKPLPSPLPTPTLPTPTLPAPPPSTPPPAIVVPQCSDIKIVVNFTNGPHLTPKDTDATIQFSSLTDVKVSQIRPWMGVHGHGAGEGRMKLYKSTIDPLLYHLDDFFLIMPGDWEIEVYYQYKELNCTYIHRFEV